MAIPMTMHFKDDEPIICEKCGSTVWAGHKFHTWNELPYCSLDCIKEAMFEEYESDVEDKELLTAEEKETICRDYNEEMEGDDWRCWN